MNRTGKADDDLGKQEWHRNLMEKPLPPLQYLVAFEAAANLRSFTKAAAQLNLTQTAVSKRIRLLEMQLGATLFVRGSRSLTLTALGEAYLQRVERALEALREDTNELFGSASLPILTVRSSHVFADQWLIPRLPSFYEQHPKISLRLITTVWNIENDEAIWDFDIRYGRGKWDGFEVDRLTDDYLVVVAARSIGGSLKNPQDLLAYPRIEVMGYQEGWPEWLTQARVGEGIREETRLVDNSLSAMSMAKAGLGVALIRSSLAERMIASGELVSPLPLRVRTSENFYLLGRKTNPMRDASTAFRSWLTDQVEP